MNLKQLILAVLAIGLIVRFGILATADEPPQYKPQMTLPIKVTEVYDGDTITVEVKIPVRVRLLDCWAPEIKGTKGAEHQAALASRDHLKKISLGKRGLLVVPLTELRSIGDLFSFDRILARLYVDESQTDVSVEQVKHKHATKDRSPTAPADSE